MTETTANASILATFQARFGRPARLFRAPARINIIGEHCDYNDGLVMPANLALYTWLAIAPRDDRTVRVMAADFQQTVEIKLDDICKNADGNWQEYPKGVLQVLQAEGFELKGADILTLGEIPLGGGLSSSASLETVVAFAMLSCAGYDIDRRRLALMCKKAENEFVGVACGIMDQYAISICERDQAMMLDCRSLEYLPTPLPLNARFLIINSGVQHRLHEGGLNRRREECERAVSLLSHKDPEIKALRDVCMNTLKDNRTVLGDILYRRCRHVVTEIQRVRDAHQAMANNNADKLGQLMSQSHRSLKDDFEVSCSELNSLVDIAQNCDGVYGARMVGAGFGGCTLSLVESDKLETAAAEICRQYGKILGQDPWYHVVETSGPVQEVAVGSL